MQIEEEVKYWYDEFQKRFPKAYVNLHNMQLYSFLEEVVNKKHPEVAPEPAKKIAQDNEMFENTFEKPKSFSVWAKAEEFDGQGKQIQIINFEVLKEGEGKPPAKYVAPDWGGTYRLTFADVQGNIKFYENRYHSFRESMKFQAIKKNQWGVMRREQTEKGWNWLWTPLEKNDQ